jgi:hypothetical protein
LWNSVDWINVAHYMNGWGVFVNVVIEFHFVSKAWSLLNTWESATSQYFSMEHWMLYLRWCVLIISFIMEHTYVLWSTLSRVFGSLVLCCISQTIRHAKILEAKSIKKIPFTLWAKFTNMYTSMQFLLVIYTVCCVCVVFFNMIWYDWYDLFSSIWLHSNMGFWFFTST